MAKKIKCGEGQACLECKLRERLSNMKHLPNFTENALNRCDWFSKGKS